MRKNEPHFFPYSRAVVHFIAYYGYNVDRWSFPPKYRVSRQKKRPNGLIPKFVKRMLLFLLYLIFCSLFWLMVFVGVGLYSNL